MEKNESSNVIFSRREFLQTCTVCTAGLTAISSLGAAALGSASELLPKDQIKPKISLVFTHIPTDEPTWPNIGYDYEARKNELTNLLRTSCPGTEFVPVSALNRDQANQIIANQPDIDGYLVYLLGIWTGVSDVIVATGKPTILVDDLYGGSGEFLGAFPNARRKGHKVIGVASSDFNDVIEAVHCFECFKKLHSSAILEVGSDEKYWAHIPYELITEHFGIKVESIDFDTLEKAYQKAMQSEARQIAREWIEKAEKVIEPSEKEIEKSAAMYLAMYELMKQKKTQAIAINCLGGFYGGKMSAYPCLGFMQLNDDGLVGACEADISSMITMLIMTYLVGRPGFISDPVIDTSKNQVIYAHCVAPTKVFGPAGTMNPYHIRSHSEDRKGACNRSLLPIGEMTTTLKFIPKQKKIVFHQGKTVDNIDEDKACRTKLAVELKGDIFKLAENWDYGWHRVTFFGDLKRPVYQIASLLGYEIVEEA